jgi:hypothetical protein
MTLIDYRGEVSFMLDLDCGAAVFLFGIGHVIQLHGISIVELYVIDPASSIDVWFTIGAATEPRRTDLTAGLCIQVCLGLGDASFGRSRSEVSVSRLGRRFRF